MWWGCEYMFYVLLFLFKLYFGSRNLSLITLINLESYNDFLCYCFNHIKLSWWEDQHLLPIPNYCWEGGDEPFWRSCSHSVLRGKFHDSEPATRNESNILSRMTWRETKSRLCVWEVSSLKKGPILKWHWSIPSTNAVWASWAHTAICVLR